MNSHLSDPDGEHASPHAFRDVSTTRGLGYQSRSYAEALWTIGRAEPLGDTGGHVLIRDIVGSDRNDLAGPYPILACADWQVIGEALCAPPGNPVSLTIVTDPFCTLSAERLAGLFDVCRPFHDHWLIDLAAPLVTSRHHSRKLRQAGGSRIEVVPANPALARRFAELYAHLVARKGIADLRTFETESLVAQLAVPGALLVTAWEGETLLGTDVYYQEGRIVRAHLSAYAPEGYSRAISYPMMAAAVDYFRPLADFIDLGGAPAVKGDGVRHFKQGWTALSRASYLCGRIFDHRAYAALSPACYTDWFPAYRAGEYVSSF